MVVSMVEWMVVVELGEIVVPVTYLGSWLMIYFSPSSDGFSGIGSDAMGIERPSSLSVFCTNISVWLVLEIDSKDFLHSSVLCLSATVRVRFISETESTGMPQCDGGVFWIQSSDAIFSVSQTASPGNLPISILSLLHFLTSQTAILKMATFQIVVQNIQMLSLSCQQDSDQAYLW